MANKSSLRACGRTSFGYGTVYGRDTTTEYWGAWPASTEVRVFALLDEHTRRTVRRSGTRTRTLALDLSLSTPFAERGHHSPQQTNDKTGHPACLPETPITCFSRSRNSQLFRVVLLAYWFTYSRPKPKTAGVDTVEVPA